MNTTPETPEPSPSTKTILFSGSDRGGVGKTFNNVQLGDALECLGYNVAYVDACRGAKTMRDIIPSAKVVDLSSHTSLGNLLTEFATSDSDDIMIIDIGPGQTAVLGEFLRNTESAFPRLGLRIVVGISINADPECVKCVMPWIEHLMGIGEFITLANHASPIPFDFDLEQIPAGDIIAKLSGGRIIHFAKLSTEMLANYYASNGKASDYLEGKPLAQALALNPMESKSWQEYRKKTIDSVSPLAKWLTGKEAQNPHPSSLSADTPFPVSSVQETAGRVVQSPTQFPPEE
jgi:hypothetical protein